MARTLVKTIQARAIKEVQTKIMSGTSTTAEDITSLTFLGLEVGAKYLVTGTVSVQASSGSFTTVEFRSAAAGGGTLHSRVGFEGNDTAEDVGAFSPGFVFTAESASLYVRHNGGGTIFGSGSRSATYIQLTKLPDTVEI